MRQYQPLLSQVALFRDIAPGEIGSMLACLEAETACYKKGDILLLAGDKPLHVGIVLAGTVQILQEDYHGSRTIIAVPGPGEFFAEALCCAGVDESPVTVVADSDCVVMKINFARILHICSNACDFHQKLIENMLGIIARKNLFLQSRMEIVRIKSVREKVLHYLQPYAKAQGRHFMVPLNREQMADYLCVDRSALSKELMKMKREGLIEYRKNSFTLLREETGKEN